MALAAIEAAQGAAQTYAHVDVGNDFRNIENIQSSDMIIPDNSGWEPAEYKAPEELEAMQTEGPPGYVYDSNSGYYYDATTGYFYDPKTAMYYDSSKGVWYIYDAENEKYITHGGDSAENTVATNAINSTDQKHKSEEAGNEHETRTATDVVSENAQATQSTALQKIPIPNSSGKIVGILYKGKYAPKSSS